MAEDSQTEEPCRLKATTAEELDESGRFAEAAARYYFDVSANADLTQDAHAAVLQHAVTCTVLAPAGSLKNRLLKNISKDERCATLIGYSLIKSMFLERLIKPAQLMAFQNVLKPHQREVDAEGASTLQRAILEHNVLALSRLYKCVSFENVSPLLGVPPDQVERLITRMITTRCVAGSVDQIESLVVFEDEKQEDSWDKYAIAVCDQTIKVTSLLSQKFPELLTPPARFATA